MRLLLAALLIISCGTDGKHSSHVSSGYTHEFLEQVDTYKHLAPRGWDVSSACDALLFVSLQHVGLGEPGPIEQAQDAPGQWFRLPGPSFAASCSSDISRDMLTGLLTYIWHFQRLDLAESLWSYGVTHNWVMGQERSGPSNRTVLSPSSIGLLADIIYALHGADHPERHIPTVHSSAAGYEAHLSMLQISVYGSIHGSITSYQLSVLRQIRTHMNQNPLVHALIHRYTDGDQSEAVRLLTTTWPQDRLPTSADWSEEWRTQRSDGDPGLSPGAGDTPHSGGDFLYAAAVILGAV